MVQRLFKLILMHSALKWFTEIQWQVSQQLQLHKLRIGNVITSYENIKSDTLIHMTWTRCHAVCPAESWSGFYSDRLMQSCSALSAKLPSPVSLSLPESRLNTDGHRYFTSGAKFITQNKVFNVSTLGGIQTACLQKQQKNCALVFVTS